MKTTCYLFLRKIILIVLISVISSADHETGEKRTASRWVRLNTCKEKSLLSQGACRMKGYQKDEAPNEGDITIYNNFKHISVSEVDETKNTLTVYLTFKMLWVDNRIQANYSREDEANTTYDNIKLVLIHPQNMPI